METGSKGNKTAHVDESSQVSETCESACALISVVAFEVQDCALC